MIRRPRKPWRIKKGVTSPFRFKYTDGDGVGIDITDYQFRTDARYTADDASPIFTLTNANGGFVIEDQTNPELLGWGQIIFPKEFIDDVDISLGTTNVDYPFVNIFIDIEYDDGEGSPANWRGFFMNKVQVFEQFTRSNDV
jgi:hypothetical protein